MLKAWSSGRSPFSGKGLGIPLERMELTSVRNGEARLDVRIFTHGRDLPRLRTVAEETFREEQDRCHVLHSDLGRRERRVKAMRRRV